MTEENKPTVTIQFEWRTLHPDNRQFKQQSIELMPAEPLYIEVQVPCTKDYIANSAGINAAMLGNGEVPMPVLTPKGLRYVNDQLENEFQPDEVSPDDFQSVSADEWDSGESEETSDENMDWSTAPLTVITSDSWDEPEEPNTNEDSPPWDENEEEWDE